MNYEIALFCHCERSEAISVPCHCEESRVLGTTKSCLRQIRRRRTIYGRDLRLPRPEYRARNDKNVRLPRRPESRSRGLGTRDRDSLAMTTFGSFIIQGRISNI
ncbi:hypothetical protein KKA96_03055 [Patescibacteria group bacterium]|nr:hypothetical protein [Patescibacteria group bacterium]